MEMNMPSDWYWNWDNNRPIGQQEMARQSALEASAIITRAQADMADAKSTGSMHPGERFRRLGVRYRLRVRDLFGALRLVKSQKPEGPTCKPTSRFDLVWQTADLRVTYDYFPDSCLGNQYEHVLISREGFGEIGRFVPAFKYEQSGWVYREHPALYSKQPHAPTFDWLMGQLTLMSARAVAKRMGSGRRAFPRIRRLLKRMMSALLRK
jgi:hypothetical protein